MKPSEAGTQTVSQAYQTSSQDPSAINSYSTSRTIKSRWPMDYSPRVVLRYNNWYPYLPVKSYICEVHEEKANVVKQLNDGVTGNPKWRYWSANIQGQLPAGRPLDSISWFNEQIINQFDSQMAVEYLNKVNQRKVSILEEAKNFRETILTIAQSVIRLKKYATQMIADPYDFVKRARHRERYEYTRGTFYRMNKSYGDAWLEGRYHWLPTYMTMRDAFIALQDTYPAMGVFMKDNVRFTDEYQFPRTSFESEALRVEVEHIYEIKYGGRYTAISAANAIAHRYGIGGVPDLAAVAIELTPWSLVLEWVLPISEVLTAMTAMDGLESFQTYKVVKHKARTTGMINPDNLLPNWHQSDGWNESNRSYTRLQVPSYEGERYVREHMNPSTLDTRLFIAKEPLNWLRALDAISFFSGSKFSKKITSGRF